MKAKDYIVFKINELIDSFEDIKLRYAFDAKANFHIIEVMPESIRRGNNNFIEKEYEINKEFSKLFPNDDLLITEPNTLTESVPTEYTTRNNYDNEKWN